VEAFHTAYLDGRVTFPPDTYIDLILIPHVLPGHTALWDTYPAGKRAVIRRLLFEFIAGGMLKRPHMG